MLTEVKHRMPLIQQIDALEDGRQELYLRLQYMNQVENPELLTMNPEDLQIFAVKWRTDLESGTMDKQKAVFRQLIESAVFDGEEFDIVPNMTT